ncbi:hypothetical protein NHH03_07595 [Stieleria sp. TO1_6]|uniref:hypothetical protein n=1 Tax=Stieleria tagensis TaxID=2956795 RepID=UPI00209A6798|nr:hypothetical protein [Stieleria tagensis]MCO8121595.1 hypothetical protein [Stieleria tagensis]
MNQSGVQFEQSEFDNIQEGYLTLRWNDVPTAVEYRLHSDQIYSDQIHSDRGVTQYRGPLPEAFVSGLADGTYLFSVDAIDDAGQVIASTLNPATVHVKHWSLRFALALAGCGLVVFLAIMALIAKGAVMARGENDA